MPSATSAVPPGGLTGPWYRDLTRYHWFVFTVASLGWLFDTMCQQLFNVARPPAIAELLTAQYGTKPTPGMVADYAAYATTIFMVGWALGGVIFGVLGDRLGRVKTMLLTILLYSIFTGLSVLSQGFLGFAMFRFLTGLGVGGEFAVGVALVAEVMPDRARPYALGWLQAGSAIGNIIAALIVIALGQLEQAGAIVGAWRWMVIARAVPAPLALLVVRKLKAPEQWQQARRPKAHMRSMRELFSDPRWRRNTFVGMGLGFAGVVGLWGIGFFSFDLFGSVLDKTFKAQGLAPGLIAGKKTLWTGIVSLLQNFGAFWGVYVFTRFTARVGRKKAFACGFFAAILSTAFTFWRLKDFSDVFWMIPIMGFCQLTLFGGYSIYFPELFPTRLLITGTSFCYNVGRLVAAVGPLLLGKLTSVVFANYDEPMLYAGVTMCSGFLIGLTVLPFAPETKGKPLPV